MADPVDLAQKHNEQHQTLALEAWRRRNILAKGAEECLDCEEPIPVSRRQAHPSAVRCVSCQEEYERMTRNV